MNRKHSIWAALVAGALLYAPGAPAPAQDRAPVRSLDDLPRHTYQLPGPASQVIQSREMSMQLAQRVEADIKADLDAYAIEDKSTLQGLYSVLLNIDMLNGDYDSALERVTTLRRLEEKVAARVMLGHVTESIIVARRAAGNDEDRYRQVFRRTLLSRLRPLAWETVGDQIKERKAQTEVFTENLVLGIVNSQLDQIVAQNDGQIGADIARTIVSMHARLTINLPLRDDLVWVYNTIIDENRVTKPDVWRERVIELQESANLTPVTVAIWDSGVDASLFPGRMWTNPGEKPDGADNDGNGFVDDIHGIAYDLDSNPVPELLCSVDELSTAEETVRQYMRGYLDLSAAIDSEEAAALRRHLGGLQPEQVRPFIEDLSLFGSYVHGTHVAGIAAEGNPFIRILVARLTVEHEMIPRLPTIEQAEADARAIRETVEYFRAHGVRIVNMSWGQDRASIESALEANGVTDPDERAELARKMFDIGRDALYDAITGAPEILFVTSAGNSDSDVEFDEMIPSSFDLPNLLVVGAVDQAGEATGFTSFGDTVDVYASGFEIESVIPGGERMRMSGTSMSAPQVVNLGAKILAHEPSFTPSQLASIIVKGTDESPDGRGLRLINPRKTMTTDIRPD